MKKIILFVLLFGFCGVIIAPSIQADEFTASYSAMETISTPRGEMTSRVFVAPRMKRMEMEGATQVLRFDKEVMWVLMPKQKMYMEKPIAAAPGGSANLKFIERKKLGQETVNGIKATKYKTVAVDKDGNRLEGFSWRSTEGILVKNDMKTTGGGRSMTVKTELSDLKVGSQNPALFEVPEGFNKFAMPSGMGKGMPGGLPGGMKIPTRK